MSSLAPTTAYTFEYNPRHNGLYFLNTVDVGHVPAHSDEKVALRR